LSDEEEYEEIEVVDVKRIIILAGLMILIGGSILSAAVSFEVIPNPLPELVLPVIELPVNEEEIFEELKQNNIEREAESDISHNQDEVSEEFLTKNERLINEFLRFGLTEDEIIGVLLDDCSNYIVGTVHDPKFELLATVKSELCFGVPEEVEPEEVEVVEEVEPEVPEEPEPEPEPEPEVIPEVPEEIVEVPEEVEVPEVEVPEIVPIPKIANGTMVNGTNSP